MNSQEKSKSKVSSAHGMSLFETCGANCLMNIHLQKYSNIFYHSSKVQEAQASKKGGSAVLELEMKLADEMRCYETILSYNH